MRRSTSLFEVAAAVAGVATRFVVTVVEAVVEGKATSA
jgi:hypothetical protein